MYKIKSHSNFPFNTFNYIDVSTLINSYLFWGGSWTVQAPPGEWLNITIVMNAVQIITRKHDT